MPHVEWAGNALADLNRIYAFLAAKSRVSGLGAVLELQQAVKILAHFPDAGRATQDPLFRELIVPFGKDAYVVLYRKDMTGVVISRVRHGRQRPFPRTSTHP